MRNCVIRLCRSVPVEMIWSQKWTHALSAATLSAVLCSGDMWDWPLDFNVWLPFAPIFSRRWIAARLLDLYLPRVTSSVPKLPYTVSYIVSHDFKWPESKNKAALGLPQRCRQAKGLLLSWPALPPLRLWKFDGCLLGWPDCPWTGQNSMAAY